MFKGKGCTKEDKELLKRNDILVTYSDNGWFNQGLTQKWLQKVLGTTLFGHRLLIWDAFKCHISDATKDLLKQMKIDVIVVPGGCTKFLQTLDVSCNKPFKAAIEDSYDNWMQHGEKTFTKNGNIRAATKTTLCEWVLDAWKGIDATLIKKRNSKLGV